MSVFKKRLHYPMMEARRWEILKFRDPVRGDDKVWVTTKENLSEKKELFHGPLTHTIHWYTV